MFEATRLLVLPWSDSTGSSLVRLILETALQT